MNQNKHFIKLVGLVIVALVFTPVSFAQKLTSPNYQIENPEFDGGGESSTSTNYNEQSSIGSDNDAQASSSNYNFFAGFLNHAYPGVPAQPTLLNTGGTLYNSLDYVVATGNNSGDAEYAIAISSDSFVTTYFVQADNTIATSSAWQSYIAWGDSSGGRVSGLDSSTAYEIKVKARFGMNTETDYSVSATATTSSASFSMTTSGVSSGVLVSGATTTITTTDTAVDYSSLIPGTVSVAAQKITVTTNAAGGYTTTIVQNNNLTNQIGQEISPVSGTNASPDVFPPSISTGAFGYHTTDATLCAGSVTRFSGSDTYAGVSVIPEEIACSASPVTTEDTYVVYKVLVGSLQSSGSYNNTITYISTAKY